MQLIEVNTSKHVKEFLMLPVRLYKNDPNWIRPLDKDIEKVFDPQKNKFFKHGQCIRWILQDEQGNTIGRVAAFIDQKTVMKDNEQPTGGMGFFECINDKKAAFLLFDACKAWLQERGMEAMDGPINFGERDEWWGLLAEGFTEPVYGMNYNFPYYVNLFEEYGFQIYFRQHTYHRIFDGHADQRLVERSQRIFQTRGYTFEHLKVNNLDKYTRDFCTIYNKAWANHSGVQALSVEQARFLINQMKPVLDEKINWFAYYNGEPVACYIQIIDANQVIKHVNGKMNWLGMLKFAWFKLSKRFTRIVGMVFGVVPEHQRKGVEAALVMAFSKVAFAPDFPYKEMEMKWIGDFNPKMMRVAEGVGGKLCKTHHTYRKLFDETREFKRSPIITD